MDRFLCKDALPVFAGEEPLELTNRPWTRCRLGALAGGAIATTSRSSSSSSSVSLLRKENVSSAMGCGLGVSVIATNCNSVNLMFANGSRSELGASGAKHQHSKQEWRH